ncbi:MAG TPA: hypothetical protein VK463_19010 [Desulfomonilaceae bacterium]|nr:hypothetical protein [Desulfomonilaceae bacterium]
MCVLLPRPMIKCILFLLLIVFICPAMGQSAENATKNVPKVSAPRTDLPDLTPYFVKRYWIAGPVPVLEIKNGKMIFASSPKNLVLELKGKTLRAQDAHAHEISVNSIVPGNQVYVLQLKDKVVLIKIPVSSGKPKNI